ncbi:hypothetical protein [Nesterenkonia marinintestina]|uniref:hypothetical protein n=1 Tax=Nesterenkonia marinintestina TaxID=2979865 RepID=UPI0021C20399|nr:hypothetical protein [Nesterenkonia sp. GX14115]
MRQLLHTERHRANRASEALAAAQTKQLHAEETADSLRTRLNLHERRSRRAIAEMSNKLATLRGQLATSGDQTHLDTRVANPVANPVPNPVDAAAASDTAPSDTVVSSRADESVTGPDGTIAPGHRTAVLDAAVDTAVREQVATLHQRLATVTSRYDQVVGQYRALFERYESLAGQYNRAAAALGEVTDARAQVATIVEQWDQLCARLATTRGRRLATPDKIILDTWRAYRDAAAGQDDQPPGTEPDGHGHGRGTSEATVSGVGVTGQEAGR